MMKENRNNPAPGQPGKQEDAQQAGPEARQQAAAAYEQADKDIANDAELSAHSPNDDLDEGETARLGEDRTGLV